MLTKIALVILQYLLEKYLWKKADDYIKSTENSYDDVALENAKNLMDDLLKESNKLV